MSSRKYNTNDNDLIWESFRNRTNHKQDSKYSKLLENDLKYIEDFLIREGIWDKVKGAAGAAAGKVKDFAADKILKPLMDMLAAAIKKDPASAEKLPELQQAAQGGGDIGAILQKNGDQSIMKKIEGQPEAGGDTAAAATPQAESYLYQFNMNSMICEALVSQGIISESKSQIIQERYYNGAIGTLFNEANKPKDCPWMPNLVVERGTVRGANGQFTKGNQSGVQFAPAEAPAAGKGTLRGANGQFTKGNQSGVQFAPAEAPAEAPAAGGGNTAGAVAKQVVDLFAKARTGNKNFRPGKTFDALQKAYPAFSKYVATKGQAAAADKSSESGGDAVTASGGTPPAEAPAAEAPAAEAPAGAPAAGPGPGAPTVGGDGSSMPTAPVADGATPSGGTEPGAAPGAGDASAPGILGKVWNFVKANKGAIGGLAAMGIAAALISFGGPLIAVPATRYLTGALIGGVRGAIKGATSTEGGFADKLKGAANQAGADSMKGGAVGVVAGAAGDAVGSVMGGAANAAAAGEVPSAAAEPYVEPEVAATSDYGGEPEDYSAGGAYDQETPEIDGTSGGFDPETGESSMDMSDEEAAAFNASQPMSDDEFNNLPSQGGMAFDAETGQELPTDANGEVPGRDYQEPTATSAAEAEAGVGTIDPVTGKEIEAIDPENKPNWRDKLKSLMPGGTKPREVFGKYTGRG